MKLILPIYVLLHLVACGHHAHDENHDFFHVHVIQLLKMLYQQGAGREISHFQLVTNK